MDYEMENIVNISNNDGFESPIKLSFDINNDGNFIGSCQITIETIKSKLEFMDRLGNSFLFKPNEVVEESLRPKADFKKNNRLGLGEEIEVEWEVDEQIYKLALREEEEVEPDDENVYLSNEIVKVEESKKSKHKQKPKRLKNKVDPDTKKVNLDDAENDQIEESKESNFECRVCGKSFTRKSSRTQHENGHNRKPKVFKCQECGKELASKSKLNIHIKTHTGEKPFECQECGKRFVRKDNLKDHVKLHSDDKPFKCKICIKSYVRNYDLKRHMATHTDDKSFYCELCGKGFAEENHLQDHIARHSMDRPFKCQVCGKAFPRNYDLTKHSKTHTDEKPFKCELCGKEFRNSDTLRNHLIIHTDEKAFECDVCGKALSNLRTLKRHIQMTHLNDTVKSKETSE
uniref:C2H2-type domain-containing protein n=3 Tax=Clytia hemisphaerica TaxID=252671 RepID=A0A7M5V395_9CNID